MADAVDAAGREHWQRLLWQYLAAVHDADATAAQPYDELQVRLLSFGIPIVINGSIDQLIKRAHQRDLGEWEGSRCCVGLERTGCQDSKLQVWVAGVATVAVFESKSFLGGAPRA